MYRCFISVNENNLFAGSALPQFLMWYVEGFEDNLSPGAVASGLVGEPLFLVADIGGYSCHESTLLIGCEDIVQRIHEQAGSGQHHRY